jgi:methylated-DNA-protein-cysteine methyltransferase-like protein
MPSTRNYLYEPRQAILATLRAIPKGHVCSYGEVAKRAGLPGYARFVCRVLRELDDRNKVPWWRVIRCDGSFAMDVDCSAGREQRKRLQAEGLVIVKGKTKDKVQGPWWR